MTPDELCRGVEVVAAAVIAPRAPEQRSLLVPAQRVCESYGLAVLDPGGDHVDGPLGRRIGPAGAVPAISLGSPYGSMSTAATGADKRQRVIESAELDRSVGWSRGCDERQLKSVALCALMERHQQVQTRGVDEGQAAQIEHQAPRGLDPVERGAQRFDGGEVEFAVGPHDRDIVASLHVDGERLGAGHVDRRSRPGRRAPLDDERLVSMPVSSR